jgi:hypothetical protein
VACVAQAATQNGFVFQQAYLPMKGLPGWLAGNGGVDPQVPRCLVPFETHVHERWLYAIDGPVHVEPHAGYVFRRNRVLERSSAYPKLEPGCACQVW